MAYLRPWNQPEMAKNGALALRWGVIYCAPDCKIEQMVAFFWLAPLD